MAQGFANYDFEIVQGTTWDDTVQVNDASGNAVDLTGLSAMMRLRPTVAGAVKLEASTANGKLTIATPANGQIQVAIDAADTESLLDSGDGSPSVYVYDLVTYDAGTPQVINPVIQGKVTFIPQVTRPWS